MPDITDIVAVVPAHNERALLPSCLTALDAAVAGIRVSVQVIVVLDSCDDDSAGSGADAFVGIITPDGFDGWPPGTATTFARGYDARPGHQNVHGANLGVRASAYAARELATASERRSLRRPG
ncbi:MULTISPECIES: hypothetical protein [Gordonia]|uniref:Glycosyltransferase n=1 Tax=Gordonia amicalis TaxID=89053 RepID=A0AAE4R6C6_9ACTN|nr:MULTISPECIES: hypothetical protein [Gordonia]MDV6307692.1 hypothetical protein [Gordonia amicalis]MDV6312523.1 hypothetical protein [Gordonia amicalis]